MLVADDYITLVASLPYLPPFEKAERVPITRLRLEQRLFMLRAEHREQLAKAENLVTWRMSLAKPRYDTEMVKHYRVLLQTITYPALRDFVSFRIDQQTILSALRQRTAGLNADEFAQLHHASRWAQFIIKHWDDAEFKLTFMYPWLPEARRLLDADDARGLDKLLMTTIWQRLSHISETNPFGFEAVFAFFFKWDILQAWFARDPVQAKNRFQEIIKEVRHGH
jgi:hypothetical protein